MTATTPTRRRPGKRRNGHRRLFLVDAALLIVFVGVLDVPLTGLAIHEWLGIVIGAATVVHLVQHGSWVASVRRRFVESTSLLNRLDFVMLGLLFVAYGTIVGSGLVISETALPFLGVSTNPSDFWVWLHVSSVLATIWLTAVHLAFNWSWTVAALRRYVVAPLAKAAARTRP